MSRWEITGRSWRRPARVCPAWCGGGHYCTAQHGYPSGQHRSAPRTIRTGYGTLILTRVQGMGEPSRLEARLVVHLAAAEPVAHAQAEGVTREVHAAVQLALLAAEVTDAEQPVPAALPGGRR